jgi:hypothetical protein
MLRAPSANPAERTAKEYAGGQRLAAPKRHCRSRWDLQPAPAACSLLGASSNGASPSAHVKKCFIIQSIRPSIISRAKQQQKRTLLRTVRQTKRRDIPPLHTHTGPPSANQSSWEAPSYVPRPLARDKQPPRSRGTGSRTLRHRERRPLPRTIPLIAHIR